MSHKEATGTVAWSDDLSPQLALEKLWIVGPKPGQPFVTGIILSPRLTLVEVHVEGKHIFPHKRPTTACDGCMRLNQQPRPRGYAATFLPGNSRVVLFEFTHGCLEWEPRLTDKSFDLRGWHVNLKRLAGEKSRVKAELIRRDDPDKCPPDVNVRAALLHRWGMIDDALELVAAERRQRLGQGREARP